MSWDDARALAASVGGAHTLAPEVVPLREAQGRVAASAVYAAASLPGFDSSAMDGWSVTGAGPWIVGTGIRMGAGPELLEQAQGTARPITTGAALPRGAEAVLRSEGGELFGSASEPDDGHQGRDGRFWLRANARALATGEPRVGQHIRLAGEEIAAGEQLWPAGTMITPPRIGLAAASGIDALAVRRRPRIALLVTGDEIVQRGVAAPGQVRDVFAPMLPGLLNLLGVELVAHERVADSYEAVASAINAQNGADVVLTTGGSSHGSGDWVQQAVLDTGGALLFAGVRMRPGHPVMLARLNGGRPLLALPGNPFAAVACLLSFLSPLLDAMTGAHARPPSTLPPEQMRRLGLAPHARDTLLVPFQWSATGPVASRWRGAAMLRGLADADGLAVLDPQSLDPQSLDPHGEAGRVLRLPWSA